MPEMAPPEETSKLVESMTRGAEPPPRVMVPEEVPVFREVFELVLLLIEVVPVMVKPPVPCSNPEPELSPTNTPAPVLLMFQVLEVPEISLPVPELAIVNTSPLPEA